MRLSVTETSPLLNNHPSSLKRENPQLQMLPSIMLSMGGNLLESSAMPKRACIRSNNGINMRASCSLLSHISRQNVVHHSSMSHQIQLQYMRPADARVLKSAPLSSSGPHNLFWHTGNSIWDAVITTGNFPRDICFGENGTSIAASPHFKEAISENKDTAVTVRADAIVELKEDQWSGDEGENPAVQRPPPESIPRKFACQYLGGSTMNTGKQACSLGAYSIHVTKPESPLNDPYNTLSLRSIMNNESCASLGLDPFDNAETIVNSDPRNQSLTSININSKRKRTNQSVLKRSDYSQQGRVRSGRWSVEEENYAKAMIEAFKAGYLPLHGNVSLRKFLSVVLVCHPMRISKKFVGYVRKYHWYRVAGKCDFGVQAQALSQLSHLEHIFWTSQQNYEWSTAPHLDKLVLNKRQSCKEG